MQAPAGDVAGHGRERSQRIDSIEVAEQQNGLDLFASREIDLHAVGEIRGAVHARTSAESLEARREQRAHAVGGQLVIAGRFDPDKRADGLDDLFLPGFEVAQSLAPYRVRSGWVGSVLLRTCCFLARHLCAALRPGAEEAPSGASRTV